MIRFNNEEEELRAKDFIRSLPPKIWSFELDLDSLRYYNSYYGNCRVLYKSTHAPYVMALFFSVRSVTSDWWIEFIYDIDDVDEEVIFGTEWYETHSNVREKFQCAMEKLTNYLLAGR